MKKFLAVMLAIMMILVISGCGTSPETSPTDTISKGEDVNETQTPKVFKAAMTANPLSIDEGYSSTTATRQVSAYVFETLFTFGDNYEIIPQMADGYTVSSDNLVYDITLRKGIKFHDGSSFRAEDVVASFERFKTLQLNAGKFDSVTSCEATGEYSVRFTLSSPVALTSLMAFPPRFTIIPKEIAEKNMSTELKGKDIIGSGPFSLGEWIPDVHVKLDKFDDYVVDNRYDSDPLT